MSTLMISKLIWKDLKLTGPLIVIFCVCGIASVFIAIAGGDIPFYVGSVLLACTLIISGVVAITVMVVGERKQSIFISTLSLPITYKDYVIAKLSSTLIFCVIPLLITWLLSAIFIFVSDKLPNGTFVLLTIFAMEMLASYCVLVAVVLTKPTDLVMGFAIGTHNIFINFFFFAMIRSEAIRETAKNSIVVWNTAAQIIVLVEILVAVAAIVFVFLAQSNKKDFV